MRFLKTAAIVTLALVGSMVLGMAADEEAEKPAGNPVVVMETSRGTITIELDVEHAPISVANFLQYVDDKFYDGTIFHRVISNFMIQGGGFDGDVKKKATRDPIKNEGHNGLENKVGTIAMARTGVVDSATAQFFINTQDNPNLNHRDKSARGYGYAVFGHVIDGMDIVEEIKWLPTARSGQHANMPKEQVVILSVRRK